jgi:nucleotidyltransferase/DNA polymerase involved in DNA repair
MTAWVAAAGSARTCWDLTAAAAVAAAVRAVVKGTLGLNVSVGVAPNKLLAKLASRAAKPDGVKVLDSVAAVQQLLQATPVDRLPGEAGQLSDRDEDDMSCDT